MKSREKTRAKASGTGELQPHGQKKKTAENQWKKNNSRKGRAGKQKETEKKNPLARGYEKQKQNVQAPAKNPSKATGEKEIKKKQTIG